MLVSPIKQARKDAPILILNENHFFDLSKFESLFFCAGGMELAREFLLKCAQTDETLPLHDVVERHLVSDAHISWRSHLVACSICGGWLST
jgi:hypothetical protein